MSARPPRTIAIVGGGASGTILAVQLARASADLRVTIVEEREQLGQGFAYSTEVAEHRLNVSARRMSAFADQPDDFLDWYRKRHPEEDDISDAFLPRSEYGHYLGEMLFQTAAANGDPRRIQHLHARCRSVQPAGAGVELQLSNGISLAAHTVVIATGHDLAPAQERGYTISAHVPPPVGRDERVVILGSGLSMVDAWLALEASGHQGEVVAISRRGLLPRPHIERRNPISLDLADIPLGTELSYFVRWFAELLEETRLAGGNWRDVIDGIRPFNQQIWRDWPLSARRRFLEHAKPWWDVHRHRIPPDIYTRASAAIADGRLRLMAGKVLDGHRAEDGSTNLTVRPRAGLEPVELNCAYALDCTGIIKDPAKSSNEVVARLIASGHARPDRLHIGLDVTDGCALVNVNGEASDRLYAIGPLTRGAFFEIDSVPEIRAQVTSLAEHLTGDIGQTRTRNVR